jgi:hypothetical protein
MNERIKELAVQADNYAYKMNPEEDSYGRPANPRKFQQDRDTKFAELIVQECAEICRRQQYCDADDEHKRGVNSGSYTCMNAIKKHFGVEEK